MLYWFQTYRIVIDRYFECQTKGFELDSGGTGEPKVLGMGFLMGFCGLSGTAMR